MLIEVDPKSYSGADAKIYSMLIDVKVQVAPFSSKGATCTLKGKGHVLIDQVDQC